MCSGVPRRGARHVGAGRARDLLRDGESGRIDTQTVQRAPGGMLGGQGAGRSHVAGRTRITVIDRGRCAGQGDQAGTVGPADDHLNMARPGNGHGRACHGPDRARGGQTQGKTEEEEDAQPQACHVISHRSPGFHQP